MNRLNIIVLGKDGMLGHMVYNYLKDLDNHNIVGLGKKEFDATWDNTLMYAKLDEYEPNFIINCIGHLNKNSEEEKKETWYLNTTFPNILADIGDEMGFSLIHISSDCAFDNNTYGMSKLAGEIRRANHLTIRTSIIGPELKEGSGLLHWFIRQDGEVNGYENHLWNGVTTLQLSEFIFYCIKGNFHTQTNLIDYRIEPGVSKFELLNLIKESLGKDIKINKFSTNLVDKRQAPEGSYTLYIPETRDLKEQLKILINWIKNKKHIYNNIYPEFYQND